MENSVFRRFILAWVSGLIWSEVKQLWDVGLEEYVNDMWNVIDFVTNSLYVATAALRVVAYYRVQKEIENQLSGSEIELQREQWDTWDPMLISEGLFSAANIFRSLSDSFYSLSPTPFGARATLFETAGRIRGNFAARAREISRFRAER